MALFCGLTLVMVRKLNAAARAVAAPGASAVRGAVIGLVIGAFFLHAWNDFAVAWMAWGLAGATIGLAGQHRAAPDALASAASGAD
jgi:hypothetical protein